jgi:hypothetical protein
MKMETKTSELTGSALNWAVVKAQGGCALTDPAQLHAHLESLGEDELWNTLCAYTPGGIDASTMDAREMIAYGLKNWQFPPYSTDWLRTGPIIERECITTTPYGDCSVVPKNAEYWQAVLFLTDESVIQCGPTPLIAAMRAYVASKLGDEVDVPEELCQQQCS